MEGRRNAALADMARDAEIERSDFLVRAGEQLERFMAAHQAKIRDLGGAGPTARCPRYPPPRPPPPQPAAPRAPSPPPPIPPSPPPPPPGARSAAGAASTTRPARSG